MTMKQAIWALVIAAALLVGFFGGRLLSVADLEHRLTELEEQLDKQAPTSAPASPKLPRVAVVQVNKLVPRYQENPTLKRQLEQLELELKRLDERMKQGKISQEEATRMAQQIGQEILAKVAALILEAVEQVASEKGYDVVLKQEDVILYYRGALLDDITEEVWARLQATR